MVWKRFRSSGEKYSVFVAKTDWLSAPEPWLDGTLYSEFRNDTVTGNRLLAALTGETDELLELVSSGSGWTWYRCRSGGGTWTVLNNENTCFCK